MRHFVGDGDKQQILAKYAFAFRVRFAAQPGAVGIWSQEGAADMKLYVVLAAASALAVVGCAKKEDGTGKSAGTETGPAAESKGDESVRMPAGFPKMTASYKGVYTMSEGPGGKPQTMTLEIAGWKKIRSEMPHFNEAKAAAGQKLVMVLDDAQNRSVAFVDGPEAPPIAVVIPIGESVFRDIRNWGMEGGKPPVKTGSDVVAGVKCDVWQSADDAADAAPDTACISKDGIFLWSKDSGASQPQIIATSIAKGSIPESRFAVPKGAEIVDMGPCMKLAQEAMAAAQSGKTPDMTKMQECQSIGQKVSAVMGG